MFLLCSSQAIPQAICAIRQLDEETLHQALQGLATAIGAMGQALQRMHGNSSLGQLIKVLPVGNADTDLPQ